MAIQLILCMETNKRAATDYAYIRDTIQHFFVLSNKVRLTPIYMGGKCRYEAVDVKRAIQSYAKDFTIGETKVIYCIDTDSYETNADHARELAEIEEFCTAKGYDLIWFCHDVEEVYVGKKIPDKQKVTEADRFRRTRAIEKIPKGRLMADIKQKQTSNILNVLGKYLKRK